MKKKAWRKIRLRKVDISAMDDRMLLANVYLTQALTLLLALILSLFQGGALWRLLALPDQLAIVLWGAGFAVVFIAVDGLLSQFVPEEVTDDGGVNEKLFSGRPLWHIAVLSFIVALCEEVLFRGVLQTWFGPYWTSILFALLHVRYLKHWLMTGLVFSVSYGLGYLAIWTGTLWTPIFAHFVIDFVMGVIIKYRRKEQQ